MPTKRTKGVLVFPTVDGKWVAGPTAHDQEDKDDWSVRDGAFDEVMSKARAMLPALEGAEPIASYAGLRPAGRGCNYVIGPSAPCPRLVNVAAIRSTGRHGVAGDRRARRSGWSPTPGVELRAGARAACRRAGPRTGRALVAARRPP